MKRFLSILITLIMLFTPMVAYAGELESASIQIFNEGYQEITFETVENSNYSASNGSFEELEQFLLTQLKQRKERIDIHTFNITPLEFRDFYADFIYTHPELFYIATGYQYSYIDDKIYEFKASYTHSQSDVDKYEAQIAKTLKLVEELTDEFQIVLSLHSIVVNACEYPMAEDFDDDSDVYDAYDALINHCAVCQGYTLLLSDLLNRAGIENTYALSSYMNHIWNQVKVDGYWYNIDATWDDNLKCYYYFMKSDTEFSQDHYGYETPYDCYDNLYDSDMFYSDLQSPIYVMEDGNYYYIDSSIVIGNEVYIGNDVKLYQRTYNGVISEIATLTTRNGKYEYDGIDYGEQYNPFYYFDGFFYYSDGETIGRLAYGGSTLETNKFKANKEVGLIYSFEERNGKLYAMISTVSSRYSVVGSICLEGGEYYSIEYELYGGKNNKDNVYDYKAGDEVVLYEPTKDGYQFDGWYTEPEFINKIEVITKDFACDLTLYAKWVLKEYSILYMNCEDSKISSYRDTYTIESSYYQLPYPERKGYIFDGWYTEPEFTNRVYAIYKGEYGDKVFYAKWNIVEYKINYYLDGGKFVDPLDSTSYILNPNPTGYTVESEFTLIDPIKPGFTFLGWFVSQTSTLRIYNIEKGTTDIKYLYAKWKENSYSIKYNLNGGTNSKNNPNTYKVSSSDIQLSKPTKTGSEFLGWYTDSSFNPESKMDVIPNGSTGDLELYALWESTKYNITYVLNGGINNPLNKDKYEYGDIVILESPERDGYTFNGWYTSTKYKTKVSNFSNTTGDKKVYAKWTKTKYSIKYNLNGGTNNKSNVSSFYFDTAIITLKNPTKSGATFLGWYSEPEFINQVTTIDKGTLENVTLYAKWELIDYTINYVLNGGENSINNPSTYTVDTIYTLEPGTKIGYTFSGWYTTNKYKTKFTKFSKTTGNMTLYAKWTKTKYSIKYNLNGGTNNKSNVSSFYFDTATITLKNPTKSGATFIGWYSEPEFINQVTTIDEGTLGNVTLYAKWELINYTINYVLGDGENSINNPSTYTVDTIYTLEPGTKVGYTFSGWYTTNKYKTKFTKFSKTTGNKTLYAKWTPNTYSIKFNPNTGTGKMNNLKLTYNKLTALTANAFKKTGYTFIGWATEPNGEVKYTNKVKVSNLTDVKGGIVNLYAVWEKTEYKITYKNLTAEEIEYYNLPTTYFVDTETIAIGKPLERVGYSFVGYYTSSSYKTKFVSIKKGSTGNKTIYVKWVANKYKLHFNSNTGSGTMKDLTAVYGTALTIKNTFKKTGYKLVGWSLNPEPVDDSEIFTKALNLTDVNGEVVQVYAIWERVEYTITYKNLTASEIEALGLPTTYNVESDDIFLGTPERTGKKFVGYYQDSKFKKKASTNIKTGSTGNKTFYIKWK